MVIAGRGSWLRATLLGMRRLIPDAAPGEEVDLHLAYAWPDEPCLRVNFVTSLDGAIAVDGRSGGLGSAADKAVFAHLRATCDVILVGAGTAWAERYGPARAPVAVVSSRLSLSPEDRLFARVPGRARPLVLTCAAAPHDRRAALAPHADLIDCGHDAVDAALAVAALRDRGFRRLLCEGGPHLFASLLAADVVDELCLTLAPLLVPGDASRMTSGPPLPAPQRATLVCALEEDGTLLLRYSLRA
jgi:riboflavin biosynthesis pyrimidine reductase